MNITLKDKTYQLKNIDEKDHMTGQTHLTFFKRGEDLTFDIHLWDFLKEVGEDHVYVSGSEELDVYDHILTEEVVKELGLDSLDKYSKDNYEKTFLVTT